MLTFRNGRLLEFLYSCSCSSVCVCNVQTFPMSTLCVELKYEIVFLKIVILSCLLLNECVKLSDHWKCNEDCLRKTFWWRSEMTYWKWIIQHDVYLALCILNGIDQYSNIHKSVTNKILKCQTVWSSLSGSDRHVIVWLI